jgi:hypothetical protein
MKPDRFLTAIIAGLALLAVAAVIFFTVQNKQVNYGKEDTAVGVLRNYIIAVQKRDYERAYSYLANLADKPTFEQFRSRLVEYQPQLEGITLQIGEQNNSNGTTMIQVRFDRSGGNIFQMMSHEVNNAELEQQTGSWKLKNFIFPYWDWSFYQPNQPATK